MNLPNPAAAEEVQPFELGIDCVVADGATERDVGVEQQARLGKRSGHVVVVTDVRNGLAGQRAVNLLHGQGIGKSLQRMRVIAQHVDDGNVADRRHALDN